MSDELLYRVVVVSVFCAAWFGLDYFYKRWRLANQFDDDGV